MIGNFIGDFVKGKDFENYDNGIRKGILLHRAIDDFTDSHPIVKQSKKRLQPKYRHYSPVIADVFYDHFLSSLWSNYSKTPLLSYTESFYQLASSTQVIPQPAKHMLKYMSSGNWLFNYQYLDGIHQALSGMSRRTKFDSKMEYATEDLRKNYEDFKAEFVAFFPELVSHSRQFLNSLE
jgi:acyl carrier protein phosphodiesterase